MKKIRLEISKSSSVVYMSGCSKYTQHECGIAYRQG